jgi:hypothetical protein
MKDHANITWQGYVTKEEKEKRLDYTTAVLISHYGGKKRILDSGSFRDRHFKEDSISMDT